MTWADSSFVVALYVSEVNSGRAEAYFAVNPYPVVSTSFSILEVEHALRLAAFRREITEAQLVQSSLRFEHDFGEGFFEKVDLSFEAILRRAVQISRRHAVRQGVRYIDLLHIASALEAKCQRFLTFDRRQGKLAKSVGLEVLP
jgi:predicted nucleic acid-binding protein